MPPRGRSGQVPGGVPRFLAQGPSTPIPPGTFLPPVTGAIGGGAATTIPVPASLLIHADGVNGSTSFTDSSALAHTLTASGGAQITTAASKFGTGAIDLSGNVLAAVDTGSALDFLIGGGPFTIEAWCYFTSLPSLSTYNCVIASQWGNTTAWWFGWNNGQLGLITNDTINNFNNHSSTYTTPPLNTWTHIAVDRDASNVLRIYVNGAVVLSQSFTGVINPSVATTCAIGNQGDGANAGFHGYLDEVLISNSICLHGGAFTPPTMPYRSDPTLLLTHMDGTAGSTTFTDSSLFNRSLTANNTAAITATAQFGTGAANFTGNVLANIATTSALSDFNFGTQPFTIEAWVYYTSHNPATNETIFAQWTSVGSGYNFYFGEVGGNLVFYYSATGGSGVANIGVAFTPTLNTWMHLACDRDATGMVRIYVNGAVVASQSIPTLPIVGFAPTWIGNNPDGSQDNPFPGYIDELRVSRGVARYAGAFTPPISAFAPYDPGTPGPLAQADQTLAATGVIYPVITGGTGTPLIPSPSCVLLMHADGTAGSTTFVDASPSVHTLYATSATVNATAKFGSGSANFTASAGSLIDTGNSTDFNFGAGPFTVEAWVYPTSLTGALATIAAQWGASGGRGWEFQIYASGIWFTYSFDGTSSAHISGSYSTPLNTWTHIAVDRDITGATRIYVNGAVVGSSSVISGSTLYPSAVNALIGNTAAANEVFTGYLDEVRITKGRAMYAGAFTPPTQPFSASNTVLLCHADWDLVDSTNFYDSSLSANTLTSLNSAYAANNQYKFGNASAAFLNTNSAIDTGNATDFNFGAGQFTIEAWCYFTDVTSTRVIVSQWGGTGQSWYLYDSNTNLNFVYSVNGVTTTTLTATGVLTANVWTHIAVDRDASSVLRLYVNGVVVGTPTTVSAVFFAARTNCVIGNQPAQNLAFNGYLDEIRVSKGVARFAGAFTPPTTAYLPDFTVGITQADQTLSAAGTVGAGAAITGTLALTQDNQTLVATGTMLVTGTLTQAQANHTLAANATLGAVTGTLNATQADQTISATAALVVSGTLTRVQADHTLGATGQIVVGGALGVTQANQTFAATAAVGETASLSLTQANQTLVATGGLTVGGALSLIQANQTLAANTNVAALPQTRVVIMA